MLKSEPIFPFVFLFNILLKLCIRLATEHSLGVYYVQGSLLETVADITSHNVRSISSKILHADR